MTWIILSNKNVFVRHNKFLLVLVDYMTKLLNTSEHTLILNVYSEHLFSDSE